MKEFFSVKQPDKYRGFACNCGDEAKANLEEMKEVVLQLLKVSSEWRIKYSHYLLDMLVKDLSARFGAEIVGIPTDPGGWSAVEAEVVFDAEYVVVKDFSTVIECDRIEDGILLTLLAFYDRFPDGNFKPEED
jgi:hypothetical protein